MSHDIEQRNIKARYKWTYVKGRESEFPELYYLHSQLGDRIKVEVSRRKKQVRITADTRLGEHIQSTISNGVIVKEKDLASNKFLNLDDYFTDLSLELSSLPDNEVLRIIGGNYRVMTEFLGQVERREIDEPPRSNWGELRDFLFRFPLKVFNGFRSWLHAMLGRPSWWDLFDSIALGALAYITYYYNFNLLLTGFITCLAALSSGLFDWVFRRRHQPYILKVFAFFLPGLFAIYIGLRFQ